MITELCIDVINSFAHLQADLRSLREHVCILDRDLPVWFNPPADLPLNAGQGPREQICALLQQLEYLPQQAPREILVGAGLVAASAETLLQVESVNASKDRFKQAVLSLKAAKLHNPQELHAKFEELLPQRDVGVATKLARMGLARLHLKQCYRRVPAFNLRPNKVSWTWANTRSIIKITVAQAEELLLKHTRDVGIERQLKLLHEIDQQEKLAIIQELAPHLRANVVLPDGYGQKRMMVKGPVPIFYLGDRSQGLPEITPAGNKRGKDKDRTIRKDVKINPEPFLPAIRAHRYLQVTTI